MLVDVKLGGALPPMVMAVMGCAPRRVMQGVYDNCGFNFENATTGFKSLYSFPDEPEDGVPSYGVADSIDQFVGKYGVQLAESSNEYAVGFTEVRRADQPLQGGWCWHKWGGYIGTKTRTCEYLHDEPDIESVVTFSVLRRQKSGKP